MPRRITTQGETFDNWKRLNTALLANIGELPHLESRRARLEMLTTEALDLVKEQRHLAARRQEATRKLKELLVNGRRLAHFLETGIREIFGTRSEKLAEFGIQPFRSRKAPAASPDAPAAGSAASAPEGE